MNNQDENQNEIPSVTSSLNTAAPFFPPNQPPEQPFPQDITQPIAEPPLQQNITQPIAELPLQQNITQPTTDQPLEASPTPTPAPAKPQKLPLILSSIAFALLSIAFLILGPGVLIAAILSRPYSWIISFYYIYLVVGASIISLISLTLYLIAFITALKKTPQYLTNISLMLTGNVIGLAAMWLSGYKIIRMSTIVMAIIMSACILLPCLGLIILHRSRKHNALQPEPKPSRPNRIFTLIALIVLALEGVVAIFYLCQLWQEYKPILEANQQYQKEQEELLATTTNGKDLSDQLSSMSFALCQGNFDIVHQIPDNKEDAIIECSPLGDVYEVHGAYEEQNGYIMASAIYYGATKDETLAQYFPDQLYIYKNLRNTSYNEVVFLLLQADSIEEVIAEYSEPLYEYIKEVHDDIDFEIYYNEDLSDITTTKDYILMAGTHDLVANWLPNGNGFNGLRGKYYIFNAVDNINVLSHLAANPGSYSKQMNTAIKFHPHLSFSITRDDQITLEELQAIMYNSQICQTSNLDWGPCNQEN